MNLESLFNRPLVKVSETAWKLPEDPESLKNWDDWAGRNPIDAAISQDDERGEVKKVSYEYDTVLAECPGGVFLDLGCGYGRIAKYVLPKRAYDGYVGVDNSAVMLKAFEERYLARPEERRTPLALVKCGIDALPFKDASVDAVFTSAVWIHNPKDIVRRSVAECLRVLKPGGKLIVFSSFLNRANPANWQERLYSNVVLPLLGRTRRNGPVRTYGEAEVRALFSAFKKTDIRRFGCRLLPNRLQILPLQVNLWTWKQIAVPFNRLVCRLLGRHADRLCLHFDVVAEK